MTVLSSAAELNDCNSQWAQGGIIYKGVQDTPEALMQDIHVAGAGRCSDRSVPLGYATVGPALQHRYILLFDNSEECNAKPKL